MGAFLFLRHVVVCIDIHRIGRAIGEIVEVEVVGHRAASGNGNRLLFIGDHRASTDGSVFVALHNEQRSQHILVVFAFGVVGNGCLEACATIIDAAVSILIIVLYGIRSFDVNREVHFSLLTLSNCDGARLAEIIEVTILFFHKFCRNSLCTC